MALLTCKVRGCRAEEFLKRKGPEVPSFQLRTCVACEKLIGGGFLVYHALNPEFTRFLTGLSSSDVEGGGGPGLGAAGFGNGGTGDGGGGDGSGGCSGGNGLGRSVPLTFILSARLEQLFPLRLGPQDGWQSVFPAYDDHGVAFAERFLEKTASQYASIGSLDGQNQQISFGEIL
jgi:hypothetical protein